jgi:hypothetical protein
MNIDRTTKDVTYTTWQSSVIEHSTITGSNIWTVKTDPTRLYYLHQITRSRKVFACSLPGNDEDGAKYELYNSLGKPVFRGLLDTAEDESIKISPTGDFLCISSKKMIKHKGNFMRENHVILIDNSGNKLWEEGSPFFRPSVTLMTGNGFVILCDGKNSLFTVNVEGDLKPSIKLPSKINDSVASPNGSQILLRNGKTIYIVDAI